jgi:hypothetical protein
MDTLLDKESEQSDHKGMVELRAFVDSLGQTKEGFVDLCADQKIIQF